jgi:hypothetical protein
MAKKRKRERPPKPPTPTTDYSDPEGNVLTLRDSVSTGTAAKLRDPVGGGATSIDDAWRRRTEMLFEFFAVRWTISGLPLSGQKELLARYRFADQETQSWVRKTIDEHIERKQPELLDSR